MFLRLLAPAFTLAVCLLCAGQTTAQTADSAYYNLGRVKLLKNSTQHVTVKAADLEKLPFANLSEAVNVWFSGYFSNASTLVYVIDGNLATDVNQYPIYDIDEITLVLNAVTQVNGISQLQQLIVVTTKRNRSGNSGVILAGQANLVKLQTNRSGSSAIANNGNAFYQQYHISAYKNINQLHFGASANYLRDVMPGATFNSRTDLINSNIRRWRFNGYLNTSLWKGTILDLTAGYAPQSDAQEFRTSDPSNAVSQSKFDGDEDLFNGSLNLHSELLPGLSNEVRAIYNNIDLNNNRAYATTVPNGTSVTTYNTTINSDNKLKNIVIYEELRYTKTAGDFTFSPAINLNYRNYKNSISNRSSNSTGSSLNASEVSSKTYLLTPTLAVGFKNALNLTVGLIHILNSSNYPELSKPKKMFPFVTASANISRLIDTTLQANIKVLGSYAVSNLFNDSHSSLSSINPFGTNSYNTNVFINNSGSFNYLYDHTFKTLSLGITAGLLHNKLELSYNYENRNSVSEVIYYTYPGDSYPYTYNYLADTKFKLHRIGIGFNLLKNNIQWKTQINVTNIRQYINAPSGNFIYPVNPLNNAWTGGWTNRLQYKHLTGGIDVQYLFGRNNFPQAETQSLDSFALQNLYIGWQVKTAKLKSLELFANGRNLTQNKKSILSDYRRLIGLGVRATF
jgi:hypothetical protein